MRLAFAAFLIFFFTVFGCRKEKRDNLAPSLKPQPEQWQQIPKELIHLTDRNIIASYSDNKNLYFLTPNVFYGFDSAFKDDNSQAYNVPGFFSNISLDYSNRIGKYSRVMSNYNRDEITIAENTYDLFYRTSTSINKTGLMQNQKGNIEAFTAPDTNSIFYLSYEIGGIDTPISQYVKLDKYKVNRNDNYSVSLIWSKIIYPATKGYYVGVEYLNAVENIQFAAYGFTLRYEDGELTDTIKNKIQNVVQVNGLLYANCGWNYEMRTHTAYPDGLLVSSDKGKTWKYIGTGKSFSEAELITFDNKLFIFYPYWIAYIDLIKNEVRQLNTNGINGAIRTVNLFRDKVYVGTDAGVYYKSLNGFLND